MTNITIKTDFNEIFIATKEALEKLIACGADNLHVEVRNHNGILYLSGKEISNLSESVVTLDDVFEAIKGTSMSVNCELKEGWLTSRVYKLAEKYNMLDRLILSGVIVPDELEYIDTVQIFFSSDFFLENGVDIKEKPHSAKDLLAMCGERFKKCGIYFDEAELTCELLKYFTENNVLLYVYTNDNEAVKKLIDASVHSINTRRVDFALEYRKGLSG